MNTPSRPPKSSKPKSTHKRHKAGKGLASKTATTTNSEVVTTVANSTTSPKKANPMIVNGGIFPNDVCYEILKYLERKQVMETFALISKQWYLVAIQQFPVHVNLKSYYFEVFEQFLSTDSILLQNNANIKSFHYHYDGIGSNWIVKIDSSYFQILNDYLKDKLTSLSFYGASIDEKGMSFLQSMTHLQSLTLETCEINAQYFSYFQHLENLIHLNLSGTKFGNIGTKIISSMKQLKSLGLYRTYIQSGDVKNICLLNGLTALDIGFMDLTPELITHICSKLTNLTSLSLGSTWSGDKIVKIICELLPNITSLDFGCNGAISYDSLVYLSKLTNLQNLNLRGCSQVGSDSDYDVQVICCMKNLTSIDLNGTAFKTEHIERIRSTLAPKLKTLLYEVVVYERDEDDIKYF